MLRSSMWSSLLAKFSRWLPSLLLCCSVISQASAESTLSVRYIVSENRLSVQTSDIGTGIFVNTSDEFSKENYYICFDAVIFDFVRSIESGGSESASNPALVRMVDALKARSLGKYGANELKQYLKISAETHPCFLTPDSKEIVTKTRNWGTVELSDGGSFVFHYQFFLSRFVKKHGFDYRVTRKTQVTFSIIFDIENGVVANVSPALNYRGG